MGVFQSAKLRQTLQEVKDLMIRSPLSQADRARALPVDRSTYHYWCNHDRLDVHMPLGVAVWDPEWRRLFNGMLLHRGASVKVLPEPDGLDHEDIAEELQLLLEQATTLSKHDIRDRRNRELLVHTADALEAVADRLRIKLHASTKTAEP